MFKNIKIRFLFSTLLLLVSSYISHKVSFELKSGILFFIPVVIASYQDKVSFKYLILFCLFTSALFSISDAYTHVYSNNLVRVLNIITRTISMLFASFASNRYYMQRKQDKIIVEQKEILEKANAELIATNNELNKFIGMAAHDIRNPIATIKMLSDILKAEKDEPAESRKWIDMINISAGNSLQILNNTLNISQIQSGMIKLNYAKVNYISFIKDGLDLNNHLAESKGQKIVLDTELDSIAVEFDQVRILQVINNLLTNAMKYSGFNTTIRVSVCIDPDNSNLIKTTVKDQGMGIDEKFYDIVFVPFKSTPNRPTGNESKTGLGLAIAKKIVDLHGGNIGFKTKPGEGSEFFFTLPLSQAPE